MSTPSKPGGPFFKRMMKNMGGAFGWHWLGGKDIAFVTRNEKFYRLAKGPNWLFLVPGLDAIAFIVESLPDSMKEMFANVPTYDGLLVSVELKLEYLFDPFQLGLPASEHARVAKRSQHATERRIALQDQAQRALLEVVSAFSLQVVCAGGPKMWQVLEQPLWKLLNEKLRPFGMKLVEDRCSIQAIIPPERVKQQMELSAERLLSAMMLRDLTLSEQAQVLRAEAVAALKNMTGGSPYMNLHDFAVGADQLNQLNAQTPELPRDSAHVIDGTARPINKSLDESTQKPRPNTTTQEDDDDDVRSMLE